jgi:hypothetical protein
MGSRPRGEGRGLAAAVPLPGENAAALEMTENTVRR